MQVLRLFKRCYPSNRSIGNKVLTTGHRGARLRSEEPHQALKAGYSFTVVTMADLITSGAALDGLRERNVPTATKKSEPVTLNEEDLSKPQKTFGRTPNGTSKLPIVYAKV